MLEQTRDNAQAGRPRLVLADDDALVRSTLSIQLEHVFDCVAEAADAEEAVAQVLLHRPDLVLLDVNMPGGGARRATREISAGSPNTVIVILSADETPADTIDLVAMGAMTYLRKGIDAPTLIDKLLVSIEAHRTLYGAMGADTTGVQQADSTSEDSTAELPEPRSAGPVRVAIADDDPFARVAIKAMIDRAGGLAFVGGAEGVRGVVDLAIAQRPDVVVLDWMMPGGGGPEAARRIVSERPDTRIVALTSAGSPQALAEMTSAGACGVLIKGCSAAELADTIRAAVTASP
jgi:DNA-binding NarL/FixJ family response regulator